VNARKISLVLALVAMSASSVFAQGDFFWSTQDLNMGATNSAANVKHTAIGQTGSLYLYYNTANSELNTGAFLDVATSMAGVINITNFETFDFNVVLTVAPGVVINERWTDGLTPGNGGNFGPGTVAGDGQSASANAFTVTGGTGIVNANRGGTNTFLDLGYDGVAQAFKFARLDYVTTGFGVTNLGLAPGSGGIVHNGQTVNPVFGAATIDVNQVIVPEPASAGLLALGLIGLVARRRR
jgi:hypothetical protein